MSDLSSSEVALLGTKSGNWQVRCSWNALRIVARTLRLDPSDTATGSWLVGPLEGPAAALRTFSGAWHSSVTFKSLLMKVA